ncbi:MAG: hypothetical protein Ct9H300mP1_14600 [Planctomycetaceae bacterium]|nr:MAG: hypothetical protein Ct9H300mP1_14600 [Planctomycetaceae bacterium]
MLTTIEVAVDLAEGCRAETPFDLWRELYDRQADWGRERQWPPLLVNFGMTLVERAVLEAVARARGTNWFELLRNEGLGIRLGECDSRLEGGSVAELLPREPAGEVIARHTVGMADPLSDSEIADGERLDDGLPQSLAACLSDYGCAISRSRSTAIPNRSRTPGRYCRLVERAELWGSGSRWTATSSSVTRPPFPYWEPGGRGNWGTSCLT